jgi:hypothetical protein
VGVQHAAGAGVEARGLLHDAPVQRKGLARAVARQRVAGRVDMRQPLRIEEAQAGIGRGDEPAAVLQPHADVAGRGMHVAALEQAAADAADGVAGLDVVH